MKSEYKDAFGDCMLKCFIFSGILFPLFYAKNGSAYYPEFVISNLIASFYIVWVILNKKYRCFNKFIFSLSVIFILYNLSALCVNIIQSEWFWEQINVSFAFFFFIILLLYKPISDKKQKNIICFLITLSTLSTIIAIITYCIGYKTVLLMNNSIVMIPVDNARNRFSWLYLHKSQYGLILLLFTSLIYVYRKYFKSKFIFLGAISSFFLALLLSYSYTALFAACIIVGGALIDRIQFEKIKITLNKIIGISFSGILLFIFICKMSKERDVLSLGLRTYIWTESIKKILNNPLGIGSAFEETHFSVPGISYEVYNCHNVFLNEMWRFSLPVGLLFTLFIFCIIIYSLKKHFSFINLGIWMALLIALNMDYSLLGNDFAIFFFYIYCIFFLPYIQEESLCPNNKRKGV